MTSAHENTDHPALIPVLRWIANLMSVPKLCARAKCRRAQWCRGEPRICLARYAPLVPEDAREGVKAMIEGRERGLSFDEAREAFVEIEDLFAWQALVDSSAARRR